MKAVSPPLEVAPAAINAAFVRQTGHIALRPPFFVGRFVRFFQIISQAIERSLPKFAVFFDPLCGLFQRLGLELHFMNAPIAPASQ